MKDRLLNLVTALCVAAALAVVALLVQRETSAPDGRAAQAPPSVPADWESYAAAGQRLGTADAPVRLILFSDYQCAFCAELHRTLQALRERDPGRVQVVFRHFPLDGVHPHARRAAMAAECAAEQGTFEAYSLALFSDQARIGTAGWGEIAADAGVPLDTAALVRCIADGRTAGRLAEDLAAGKRLGVGRTPTTLVNGRRVVGAVSLQLIDSVLALPAR